MKKSKEKAKRPETPTISSVSDLYTPIGSNLCQDVLLESNGNVSLLRLLDFMTVVFPAPLPMWLVCDLAYNPALSPADYAKHDVLFEAELVNPKGSRFPLVSTTAAVPDPNKPMIFCRLLFNLSGALDFVSTGLYVFEVYAKLGTGQRELLLIRPFGLKGVPAPAQTESTKSKR